MTKGYYNTKNRKFDHITQAYGKIAGLMPITPNILMLQELYANTKEYYIMNIINEAVKKANAVALKGATVSCFFMGVVMEILRSRKPNMSCLWAFISQ